MCQSAIRIHGSNLPVSEATEKGRLYSLQDSPEVLRRNNELIAREGILRVDNVTRLVDDERRTHDPVILRMGIHIFVAICRCRYDVSVRPELDDFRGVGAKEIPGRKAYDLPSRVAQRASLAMRIRARAALLAHLLRFFLVTFVADHVADTRMGSRENRSPCRPASWPSPIPTTCS